MKTVVAATVMMTGALSETALVGQVSRVRSLIIHQFILLKHSPTAPVGQRLCFCVCLCVNKA